MIYIELAAIFLVQILILIRLEMVTPAPEREIHPAVREVVREVVKESVKAAKEDKPEVKQKPRSWSEVRQKAEAE